MVVEPVDGAASHIFRHPLDLVVVGPAIPAVQIALVLDEQIRGDGVELSW
jgi:hypothetical protein